MPKLAPKPRTLLKISIALLLAATAEAQETQEDGDWSEFETTVATEARNVVYDPSGITEQAEPPTPFQRRINREEITIRVKTLRLDSGKKVQLVYGVPKKAKSVPAVFVMDVETNAIATAPTYKRAHFSKQQQQEFLRAAYLVRSPFGSNMLGNGFAVAYVVADDLETLRSARTPDWIGIFDRVRALKAVDGNNIFLFSTREYANLSIFLTTKYNFSGFILEEPGYLLFSNKSHEDIIEKSERLSSEEIWSRTDPTREYVYERIFNRINTPIVLVRNPDSRGYAFSEKTLIPKLNQSRAYYQTIEVHGLGRQLTVFGGNSNSGVIDESPKVTYDPATVKAWVSEVITYMRLNSSVTPIALSDPAKTRRW